MSTEVWLQSTHLFIGRQGNWNSGVINRDNTHYISHNNKIESPQEIMVKKLHQVPSAFSNSTTQVTLSWVHKKLHFYSDATRKFRPFSNMQDPH